MIDNRVFVDVRVNISELATAFQGLSNTVGNLLDKISVCEIVEYMDPITGKTHTVVREHIPDWFISPEARYTAFCVICQRSAVLPRYFTIMESITSV